MKQQDSLWIIVICSFKPCCKINNSNSTSKISSSIILGSNLHVFSWYVFILELFITYCTVLRSFLDCIFICLCVMRLFFDVLSQRWHCWYHFWIKSSRVFSRCALFLNLFITCWTVKIAFFDPIFICLRTTRRHMKIQLKNDIITVQHVIQVSSITALDKCKRRFNQRIKSVMSNLWQLIQE